MLKWKSLIILSSFSCFSAQAISTTFLFPKQQISFGFYQHNQLQIPPLPKPIFWNSRYQAETGFSFHYLHMIYHTQKHFSVLLGTTFSNWNIANDALFALSGLFELRWWIFRTEFFNPYFIYSIAAPTLLSNNRVGNSELGGVFIFQDYWGFGFMLGKERRFNFEFKNVHYSNGDLAMHNSGLQIPFLFSIGYAW